MGNLYTIALILVLLVQICCPQGFSNYRTAFHQDLYLTENDLRDATPQRPRRLSDFTATSLSSSSSSSVDIVFSMTNRDKVPDVIQFRSEGNKCTLLVTGPLDYRKVASVFPGGSIPLPMKASNVNDPNDFALFNLVLNLKDSNDHAPDFVESSLKAYKFPSQKLEDINPIFRLRATDEDAVETGNGKVTYRLRQLIFQRPDGSTTAGDLSSWFRIDAETGNVDLLQPLVDDREMQLTVFASDSPLLSKEAPKTTTTTAVLKPKAVEDAIAFGLRVDVEEGSTSKILISIPLSSFMGGEVENIPLRFTILNRNDVPKGISAKRNEADLTLETAEPLDLETDGPSFRVDILAESRDTGLLEPRIARVVVKVKNVEDEEPAFFLESLVNTIYRNADLRDINPVLRVRAMKRDDPIPEKTSLKYSIQSVAIKRRGRDTLAAFYNDNAIEIEAETGNVKLLKPINDLVDMEVEEIMVEVVVEDGSLVTKEMASIRLFS